jgi:hypothetical protein
MRKVEWVQIETYNDVQKLVLTQPIDANQINNQSIPNAIRVYGELFPEDWQKLKTFTVRCIPDEERVDSSEKVIRFKEIRDIAQQFALNTPEQILDSLQFGLNVSEIVDKMFVKSALLRCIRLLSHLRPTPLKAAQSEVELRNRLFYEDS